ncbi:hypothetical protein QLL95_gp0288 [Cotonvirus japonicus]|uniref:Uncharacterized protein n=1 Tax=Cotonvirus japonicus TaxID=2811091 RepID=A0ABM7NRR5_9VIRU|nr:hypothetical protein QLL95_gp0288 [Cotonvirus japonicus]BCS82777.1 hypothetical protein [Cotonvirus japonicus]
MGNYINRYFTKQIIDQGDFVLCKNCNEIATYRCRVSKNNTDFNHDHNFMGQYLYIIVSSSNTTIQYHYVACSKCISIYKQVFAHYPSGWKESDKVYYTYELANFDDII